MSGKPITITITRNIKKAYYYYYYFPDYYYYFPITITFIIRCGGLPAGFVVCSVVA